MPSDEKRVAIIVDRPGWAWWRRARGIAKYAPEEIQVTVFLKHQWDDRLASRFAAVVRRFDELPVGVDDGIFVPRTKPGRGGRLRVGWCGHATEDPTNSSRGWHKVMVPLMQPYKRGPYVEKPHFFINRRGYEDRLDTEGMVEFYNSFDVLLVTGDNEHHPSVLLEAMACGRSAVVTDVGFESKAFISVGSYRNNAEATAVSKCMRDVLDHLSCNAEEVFESGREARELIESQYSLREIAPRWLRTICG